MPSRLPRPVDWALAAGSTWIVSGLPPDAGERLALGIGLRTGEGYGQVVVLTGDDDRTPDAGPGAARDAGHPEAGSLTPRVGEPTPATTASGLSAPAEPAEPASHAEMPAPEPSLVERFVAAVPKEVRLKTLKSARGPLRLMADLPPVALPVLRPQKVESTLAYPWAMGLPAGARDALRTLLAEETDLTGARAELDAAIRREERP